MISTKRKVCEQCAIFKEDGTGKYVFVENKGKPICLMCHTTIFIVKTLCSLELDEVGTSNKWQEDYEWFQDW
jgi:hypothetical protein